MPLSGPHPYIGGDVALIAGLYAAPGTDSAAALIDVVGAFAALDPGTLGHAAALSTLIANGCRKSFSDSIR